MTKKEYLNLQKKAQELADAYYNQDTPLVSDDQYDNLMRQIKAAEKEHPDWVTKDSITQVIGGVASTKFQKVEHDVPMLSIEDVFDKESVKEWVKNVKSIHPDATFTVEEKIDGLSCTLRYRYVKTLEPWTLDGLYQDLYQLVLAETRGNGFIGEDVTENVLQVEDVPATLVMPHDTFGDEFQIRGEIYMNHEDFERYNKSQIACGKEKAANARNLAAGTLRQKDAALVKERGLHMFIFRVQKVEGARLDNLIRTQYDAMQVLSKWFNTVLCYHADCFETIDSIIDQFEKHKDGRFGYDIDGAVVKVNEIAYQDDFKGTAKYSAGHIAYKYPQAEKKARLTDIEIGVGRTGKLSFTGVVCDDETGLPLSMCGTEVSRVTLNNMDYIRDNHIGIGGVYGIIKSGEIIPKLTGTVYKEPEKVYEVPDVCPFCGARLQNKGSVDWYCTNNECEEKLINQYEYFCGRNQMNIEGISSEMLRFLFKNAFLLSAEFNPVELYCMANEYKSTGMVTNVTGEPLHVQEGWGETSVKNMVDAINKSRKTTFDRVLVAQGIPNIGHGQVKLLKKEIESVIASVCSHTGYEAPDNGFDYFEVLMSMYDHTYDFNGIEGFGPVIVSNLIDWIQDSLAGAYDTDDGYNTAFGDLLKELNIERCPAIFNGADTLALDGLTFCCTGSVETFKNREELFAWIERFGGKTTGSVSKKTSYLVNNDVNSTSSKNKNAKELNIPIITEAELKAMVAESEAS